MSSLPSFEELMSSLGLEDGSSHPHNVRSFLRPRSHSNASSSSDIDDEREHSPQQYTPSGTYLFVSADCDRRDCSNLVDVDGPRVSRHSKGRYSPYPTDSVRTNASRWFSAQFNLLLSCRSQGRQAFRHCSRQRRRRGYILPQLLHMSYVNADAVIGAFHLATVLPSHPGTSGTEVLSKREIIKAWQRDVATRSRYPVQHSHFDVFAPEIPPDVTDIRNVSADGI